MEWRDRIDDKDARLARQLAYERGEDAGTFTPRTNRRSAELAFKARGQRRGGDVFSQLHASHTTASQNKAVGEAALCA